MLVFYQISLMLSAIFLIGTAAALLVAQRNQNFPQIYMLRLLRLGLIFSACSCMLRILDPPPLGHVSLLSFIFCLLGTMLISMSFREYLNMQGERKKISSPEKDLELSPTPLLPTGLPQGAMRLSIHTQQALGKAQNDALSRRQSTVDTEHLLLGLLRTPQCEGVSILSSLDIALGNLHRELTGCPDTVLALPPDTLVLTERARQVIVLAGQEAHRFDQSTIGTEHLLLGLVLMGKGKAASLLFQEGVTVDAIRWEILKTRRAA